MDRLDTRVLGGEMYTTSKNTGVCKLSKMVFWNNVIKRILHN